MKQIKNWILGVALAVMLTVTACTADYLEINTFTEEQTDLINGDYVTVLDEIITLAMAGNIDAQMRLAYIHYHGLGVPMNHAKAKKWYLSAAEAGHVSAQYNLGWMYENGRGVSRDNKIAVKWYRLAAEAGHAFAQYNLGQIYENGEGVDQDKKDKIAVKWYRLAAEAGHIPAQYKLGWMYANGWGIKQNHLSAYMWFYLANQVYSVPSDLKEMLDEDMSRAKIEKAKELAWECLARNYKDC